MNQAWLTAGIILIPVTLFVLGNVIAGKKINFKPLLWAGFAILIYFVLLRVNIFIPGLPFSQNLDANWLGKSLAIAGSLLMLRFLPQLGFAAAGFRWKQNPGSVQAVLITGAITLVILFGTAQFVSHTPDKSIENLLFQAIMPGLDEEIFFRGLLLFLFSQAFGRDLSVFGAKTGSGFWLVVLLFGLLHGITLEQGSLSIQFAVILGTGYLGFILTWMRERSGSLVAPILFHNMVNVFLIFV